MKVALIIPTRNGEEDLSRLLKSVSVQTRRCDIFVVDSDSDDDTVGVASSYGANITTIPVSEFNHGGTRQKIVMANPDFDIYIFMTQDAYLADEHAVEHIIEPFANPSVGAVCGRQLPHLDANLFAEHARLFNYPGELRIKSMDDVDELGIKVPFISNSFSAYRREALVGVGGFPSHVILSEDMYVAARMLMNGWKISYAGHALCRHSHNYTILEEFRRYFDTGVFHAREPWIRAHFGGAGGEGLQFVKSELNFLGWRHIYLWPASLFRNAFKFLGYNLGLHEERLPLPIKQWMSMHKRFWNSTRA
jgi:rhamnosyltransferase